MAGGRAADQQREFRWISWMEVEFQAGAQIDIPHFSRYLVPVFEPGRLGGREYEQGRNHPAVAQLPGPLEK